MNEIFLSVMQMDDSLTSLRGLVVVVGGDQGLEPRLRLRCSH
jgi:hypothetical protein